MAAVEQASQNRRKKAGVQVLDKNFTPDEIVCHCKDLSQGKLNQLIVEGSINSFEELLSTTDAGSTCTACVLDLEFFYAKFQQERTKSAGQSKAFLRSKKAILGPRAAFWRFVDSVSPHISIPITEMVPVLCGEKVRTRIVVSNHRLFFQEDRGIGPVDLAVVVRDDRGRVVHSEKTRISPGQTFETYPSDYLDGGKAENDALTVGWVSLRRRWPRQAFIGATRPQVIIEAPKGVGAVHFRGPKASAERWVSVRYQPADQRAFVSVVNIERKSQVVEISYAVSTGAAGAPERVIETVTIVPNGVHLHEVRVPDELADSLNGLCVLDVCIKANGWRQMHLFYTDKNLDRISVDHL